MERFLLLEYRFGGKHGKTLLSTGNGLAGFLGRGRFFARLSPEMFFYVDSGLDDWNAFGFEELFLQGSVRLADKDFAVGAKNTVPGDAFALWGGTHGAACGAGAAGETQGFSKGSIS
jgi:hypothetical protein